MPRKKRGRYHNLVRDQPEQVRPEQFLIMVSIVVNTAHISGGAVGALNVGGIQTVTSIDMKVRQLMSSSGSQNIGEALKALTQAISSTHDISSDQKRGELLEQIEVLGQQAVLPKEQHKRGVIKAVVDSLAGVCSGAGGLAAVWQTWGPAITRFFSIGTSPPGIIGTIHAGDTRAWACCSRRIRYLTS